MLRAMRAPTLPVILVGAAAASACGADAPTLGQTEQAAFTLSTTELDFGNVVVNSAGFDQVVLEPIEYSGDSQIDAITYDCPGYFLTHDDLPFIVGYTCEQPFVVGAAPVPGGFCEPGEQPVAITRTIGVAFMPTALGPHACEVTIETQFDGTRTVSITGNSIPTPHDISVLSPTTLPFGQQPLGTTSAPGEVTVRSVGSQALSFSSIVVEGEGFALVSGNGAPHTLAPNTDESFAITCAPTVAGPLTGTLTLTHDSDDVGERPTVFELTCEGIESNLAVTPSPVSLPVTRVGEPTEITLTLSAALPGTNVMFESASIAGAGLSITDQPSAGATLTAAAPGQLTIAFAPTADGDVNGVLTIEHDDDVREVSVLAPARLSTLAVTPSGELAFGPVCPGDDEVQTVVINNPGSAPYNLDEVELSGAGFTLALLAPEALPAVIDAAGATSASLTVTAAPAEGPQTGTLTIRSDVPDHEVVTVATSATGMPAGVAATPLDVDFGDVVVGDSSAAVSVYLSNCVASGLTIVGAEVTGPDAADFVIVQAPTSMTIGASQAAEWVVQLQPDTAGDKVATLELTHEGGTEQIELRGASALDADDVRGTYYACRAAAAGDGGALAGAGLLALAALGAVGRRRRGGAADHRR
jgi:hypothetical protein